MPCGHFWATRPKSLVSMCQRTYQHLQKTLFLVRLFLRNTGLHSWTHGLSSASSLRSSSTPVYLLQHNKPRAPTRTITRLQHWLWHLCAPLQPGPGPRPLPGSCDSDPCVHHPHVLLLKVFHHISDRVSVFSCYSLWFWLFWDVTVTLLRFSHSSVCGYISFFAPASLTVGIVHDLSPFL